MTPEESRLSATLPDYDVALSFAGEHRRYVGKVADGLRAKGFAVFYDEFERVNLIGQELIAYLQQVYSHRSATVAAFISQEWVTKPWTGHERQTALAHALLHSTGDLPFLLPLRFDDTPVPGLHSTVGYEDLRQLRSDERRWRQDSRFKHPTYVVDFLADVLRSRGLSPRHAPVETEDEGGVPHLLAWVQEGKSFTSQGLVPPVAIEEGVTEIFPDEVQEDGPPAGRYELLPASLGVPINPNEGLPVFLIDTHNAYEKTWTQPLPQGADEPAVADVARRRVQDAVDQETIKGAVPLGPTFTRGLRTPLGLAIVGTCILAKSKDSD